MVNGYPLKAKNFTIFKWKAKEKWRTQQVKLQARKQFKLQKGENCLLQNQHLMILHIVVMSLKAAI